ncbi:MAG: DUF6531 domain-containing protein, partial [Planctomycetota bacterium]
MSTATGGCRHQIQVDRGEEVYTVTDLHHQGVGFDWSHTRTYRSQETNNTPQGRQWTHLYDDYIIAYRIGTFLGDHQDISKPLSLVYCRGGEEPGDNDKWDHYKPLVPSGINAQPSLGDDPPAGLTMKFDSHLDTFAELKLWDQAGMSGLDGDGTQTDWRDDHFILISRGGWVRRYEWEANLPGVTGLASAEMGNSWKFAVARLVSIKDVAGNEMTFSYTVIGGRVRLSSITDTRGALITYSYYPASDNIIDRRYRLKTVRLTPNQNTPTESRSVTFDYDEHGDLVKATGADVGGHGVSGSFSGRPVEIYKYSSTLPAYDTVNDVNGVTAPGPVNSRLRHNLMEVVRPNEWASGDWGQPEAQGKPALQWTYYDNDRVKSHSIGFRNAQGDFVVGEELTYTYQENPGLPGAEILTTETDRNGNVRRYYYDANSRGSLLRFEHETRGVRDASEEPSGGLYVTTHTYNANKLRHITRHPSGRIVENIYDTDAPERRMQSNRITQIQRWDSATVPALEADQEEIVTEFVYDPFFNQPCLQIDPRRTHNARPAHQTSNPPNEFTPPNGPADAGLPGRYVQMFIFDYQEGRSDDPDYRQSLADKFGLNVAQVDAMITHTTDRAHDVLGLGPNETVDHLFGEDLNNDGKPHFLQGIPPQIQGKHIKTISSVVYLPDGSEQAAESISRYDGRGRLTYTKDARDHVTTYEYSPTNDLLLRQTAAAGELDLETEYARDAYGNPETITDPRGNQTRQTFDGVDRLSKTQSYVGHYFAGQKRAESEIGRDPNGNVVFRRTSIYEPQLDADKLSVEPDGEYTSVTLTGTTEQRFEYDILNNVIKERTEATAPADAQTVWLETEYEYDANENVTRVTKPEGNITETLYDERDLPFRVVSGVGTPDERLTFSYYDLNGNLIETVDGVDNGGETKSVTAVPGLGITAHTGDVTRYEYDAFDRLVRTIDPIGNVVENTYDPAGQIVSTAMYGPIGGLSPTDSAGAQNVLLGLTNFRYDERGRMYRKDRLLGVSDGVVLNRSQHQNLNDSDARYMDDPASVSGIQRYGGFVSTETVFDPNGNPVEVYDDKGNRVRTQYDEIDRPFWVKDAEDNVTETSYDENSNPIYVKHTYVSQDDRPDQVIEAFFAYDALNRKTRAKANPNPNPTLNPGDEIEDLYGYDSRGNLVMHQDGRGNSTRSFYDDANRLVASVAEMTADGTGATSIDFAQGGGDGKIVTRYLYDGNSNLVGQVDDNNNRTTYAYDALDRRVQASYGVSWPLSAEEATAYVVLGASPGNLAEQDDPVTSESWAYDRDSNVTRHTDQNGWKHEFEYDGANRRTQVDISVGTSPRPLFGTTQQRFEYDGLGRTTKTVDNMGPEPGVECTHAYDTISRTLQETQEIQAAAYAKHIQHFEYDGDLGTTGALQASRHGFGPVGQTPREFAYTHDANNRLRVIQEIPAAAGTLVTYDYVGPGASLARRAFGNGQVETRTYDGIHRLTGLATAVPNGGVAVDHFAYAYDGEHLPKYEDNLLRPGQSAFYGGFDSAKRVVLFARGTLNANKDGLAAPSTLPDDVRLQSLEYDGLGNWTRNVLADGGFHVEDRTHTNFNEVHAVNAAPAKAYDDNGNLLDDGTRTYRWDALNRLIQVSRKEPGGAATTIASYLYDTQNRRVRQTLSGGGLANDPATDGQTTFYSSGWRLCAEYDVAGGTEAAQPRYRYVWGGVFADELVCRDDGAATVETLNASTGTQRQYQHVDNGWNIRA